MSRPETATIAARVSPVLKARLEALAHDRRTTVSALLIALVERELENEL